MSHCQLVARVHFTPLFLSFFLREKQKERGIYSKGRSVKIKEEIKKDN